MGRGRGSAFSARNTNIEDDNDENAQMPNTSPTFQTAAIPVFDPSEQNDPRYSALPDLVFTEFEPKLKILPNIEIGLSQSEGPSMMNCSPEYTQQLPFGWFVQYPIVLPPNYLQQVPLGWPIQHQSPYAPAHLQAEPDLRFTEYDNRDMRSKIHSAESIDNNTIRNLKNRESQSVRNGG